MKNEILLSTLLLASPISGMTQAQFKDVIEESRENSKETLVFETPYTVTRTIYRWNRDTREDEIIKVKSSMIIRLTKGIGYHPDLEDYQGGSLDYEVEVLYKDKGTGEITNYGDYFYYADKHGEKNYYSLYECDSSARCSGNGPVVDFAIYDSPDGQVLVIKKNPQGAGIYEDHPFSFLSKKSVFFLKK